MTGRPGVHWWTYVLACVYAVSLGVSTWSEAVGPAGAGLQITWPSGSVARVRPNGPMERAGLLTHDVIEVVDGRAVASETDWFLARASFERFRPIPLQVRRRDRHLTLAFTITAANAPTWPPGVIAFRLSRVVVLVVAIYLAVSRPNQLTAQLAALILAMVAVAEGFPPAGWVAYLRRIPAVVALPAMTASTSWLLIAAVWFALWDTRARRLRHRRLWRVTVAGVFAVFGALVVTSSTAILYRPAWLAMPSSFIDSREMRFFQSIFGVVPQLFLNLWPFYAPAREMRLLEIWFAATLFTVVAGFVTMTASASEFQGADRRRMSVVAAGLIITLAIGVHNVVARNWANLFDTAPPALFGSPGLVAEAIAFALVVIALGYVVLTRRERRRTADD